MKKIALLTVLVTALLQNSLFPATMYDPGLEWKSIKTEHFWIHYHQGIENEAKRLSIIAEKVHDKLVPLMRWAPELRTDVVLIDNMYTANGFATPTPFNKIQVYLTRPEPDSVLSNFDDWIEMVFTHEYTHILIMDSARGFPAGIRAVFGRCCFPNAFVPYWMAEGGPVYNESLGNMYGRNNSTYTDMVLRMEVQSGNLKSLSEASTIPRLWPTGSVPYLYGGLFVEYIERKYGKGSMTSIYVENSDNLIPFSDHFIPYILPFVKSSEEIVLNDSFLFLWDEWEEFIRIKYNRQISRIKEDEITDYKRITSSGYRTTIPRFSKDGNYIYYIRSTNYNETSLMRYSLKKKKSGHLCRVNDPNSIAVSKAGDILLSDAEVYRSFSIYNEAFSYDGSYEKNTTRLRGSYIDITDDGKKTVYVNRDRNKYSIVLSDKSFKNKNRIISKSGVQISYTKFSPGGERVLFTLKDNRGYADLAVLDIQKDEILRLTDDEYNDIEPAWHPDGNRIIFSSDRDGVYNLYEYNLKANSISRITNLIGGAFSPEVSPDGKTIAFAAYGKRGFDIALLEYPEATADKERTRPAQLASDFFKTVEDEEIEDKEISSEDYTVWNSIMPPFWLPILGTDEPYEDKTQFIVGFASPFFVPANDALLNHTYLFDFIAYTYEERMMVNAYYMYSGLYPNFIFQYYNDAIFYGEDDFPWERGDTSLTRETEKAGIAGVSLPFLFYRSMHIISLSYNYSKTQTDIYEADTNEVGKYRDTEAKIRFLYNYDNTGEYAYSISKEHGRDFYIVSEVYDDKLSSDLSYTKIFSEYSEYLPGVWENNVTMLRLRGGVSFNNPQYKAPFTLGRFERGDSGSAKAEEESFGLRGYPSGLVYGNMLAMGTLEYRFPVIQSDAGFGTIPFMFRDLYINIFYDFGNVWEDEMSYSEFRRDIEKLSYTKARESKLSICDINSSAGIELNMRITLAYVANFTGYIGYARGFNEFGEDQVYFGMKTYFEGAFKNKYKWLDYL